MRVDLHARDFALDRRSLGRRICAICGAHARAGELAACDVVAQLRARDVGTAVRLVRWDCPHRQGVHDYWFEFDDTQEALEITTLAEQDTITDAAHWRKRGPGCEIVLGGLKNAWYITIDAEFSAIGFNSRAAARPPLLR